MTKTEAADLERVRARLLGHDPEQWFKPELAAIRVGGRDWVILKKDSTLLYFGTEEDAWHFRRTGDRSKVLHD